MTERESEHKFLTRMNMQAAYAKAGWVEVPIGDLRRLVEIALRYRRLDSEASEHIEGLIALRSKHFTGEPPYVGWRGLGKALGEDYDELEVLREQAADAKDRPI